MDPDDRAEQELGNLLTDLLIRAVERILAGEPAPDFPAFLAWMQDELPKVLGGATAGLGPRERHAPATAMAIAVWNATPLPSRRFRPASIPLPGRNDPCLCGSGTKYKRCCGRIPESPPVDPEAALAMVLDHLPPDEVERAFRDRLLPQWVAGGIALGRLEEGEPEEALALVSPIFDRSSNELRKLDGRYENALAALLDAYDALYDVEEKEEALDRLRRHLRPPLRAAVWIGKAMIAAERGELEEMSGHLERAREDDPENPDLPSTELAVYLASGDVERVRECAEHWSREIRREGDPEANANPLAFLDSVADDPEWAMLAAGTSDLIDPELLRRFLHVIRTAADRPLPELELVPLDAHDPAEEFLVPAGDPDLARAWSEVWPAETDPEIAWGDEDDAENDVETAWADDEDPESDLEGTWENEGSGIDSEIVWADEVAADWIGLLEKRPEAMDDLAILDDLLSAISSLPDHGTPWCDQSLALPLLTRARAIVERMAAPVREAGGAPRLPWGYSTNETALLLLYEEIETLWHLGHDCSELIARMLELDPEDHLDVGELLANDVSSENADEDWQDQDDDSGDGESDEAASEPGERTPR